MKYLLPLAIILFSLNVWFTYENFKPVLIIVKENNQNVLPNVLPIAKDLPMKEAVLNTVASYGIDKRIAERIINCESKWNPKAKNKNSSAKGLWQIMKVHKLSDEVMFDPIKSTKWAMNKRLVDKSFGAWSCDSIK